MAGHPHVPAQACVTGGAIGRVGAGTMQAISDYQRKIGMEADGYAGVRLLARLRRLRLATPAVVFNAVTMTPGRCVRCRVTAAAVEREIRALATAAEPGVGEQVRETARPIA